jgi:nucleoside phosphorylase
MKLIHLAHRGEAQQFLKDLDVSADQSMEGLYIGDNEVVLIGSEGIENTLAKLAYCLGRFKISEVLNFGIAGALDKNLNLDEVYEIRTSYCFNEKIQYKSFQANLKGVDCITTNKRVLESDYAEELSNFAPIVDRELWAIGFVCKTQNIPFSSYKLISDYAGAQTNCFDIKEKAGEYSIILSNTYKGLVTKIEVEQEFSIPLHLSFTHKKLIDKKMKIASKKYDQSYQTVLENIKFNEILGLEIREKEKVSVFLTRLEEYINPINHKALNLLKKEIEVFEKIGAKIVLDSKLENEDFNLQMKINSQTNIDNLKRACEQFSFSKYQNVWNGEFDV